MTIGDARVIIDAHAHIFREVKGQTISGPTRSIGYGRIRRGSRGEVQLLPPLCEHTTFPPEVLLAYMDWVGVDKAVLLQGPLYGEANALVSEAVTRWPDRFIGAGYVDPRAKDARTMFHVCVDDYGFGVIKLELSEDAGLVGLHPDLRLDEPEMAWLWEEAERRKLVVTLDLGSIGTKSYQTDAVRMILVRHPSLRIVIAHLGHPPADQGEDESLTRLWHDQLLLARDHQVWFDLAALPLYGLDPDYPYAAAREHIRLAVDMIGADRLMWGTDVPGLLSHATYQQLLDFVARHCDFLSQEDLEKVLSVNACQVYGSAGTSLG
jgi:predicted TIM-barrel fold metal-dependent hydrolase